MRPSVYFSLFGSSKTTNPRRPLSCRSGLVFVSLERGRGTHLERFLSWCGSIFAKQCILEFRKVSYDIDLERRQPCLVPDDAFGGVWAFLSIMGRSVLL